MADSDLARLPTVRAKLTLLPSFEHPRWPNRGKYMPHVVVGDPSQRTAIMGPGNTATEDYLGVLFADAPDEIAPGQTVELTFVLMYWPGKNYERLVSGATFTLREGAKIVGFGQVL